MNYSCLNIMGNWGHLGGGGGQYYTGNYGSTYPLLYMYFVYFLLPTVHNIMYISPVANKLSIWESQYTPLSQAEDTLGDASYIQWKQVEVSLNLRMRRTVLTACGRRWLPMSAMRLIAMCLLHLVNVQKS